MKNNITFPVAAQDLTEWTEGSGVSQIALPTLWVADALKARHLAQLFQVIEYSQATLEISAGEHYILLEPETSEALVKSAVWRIKAAGGKCYLHGINQPLEYLVAEAVSARELTLQIFDVAEPYENWKIKEEERPLTFRLASEVAKVAMKLLRGSERTLELGTLRQRCKQSVYEWRELMVNFEQEFKKELSRRGKDKIERLGQEIQSTVESSLEQMFPARSKSKQMLNLLRDEWGSRLRFNTMTIRPELDGKPLDMDTLAIDLIDEFDIDISHDRAAQIVLSLAKKRSYSPVQEYLEQVAEQYSSVDLKILDDIATRYFGTNEPLHNVFMRKHLIGQVQRVFEPGCQHDTALVLQGTQGLQKSKFWRTLAVNPDWFDDTITSGTNDKDERLKLRRFWISELAELESVFKRKEIAGLRAFFTTPADNLRVPYGRSIESFPRTSCFVGSVNPAQFLVDPEGHRRYWIIPVTVDEIPVEKLAEERDLLWAAAVIAYRNGETNYLTKTDEKRNALLNKHHEVSDTWDEAIDAFLKSQSETTVSKILSNCLEIELAKHDRVSQMRVAECLKRIGWVKCEKKRVDGDVSQIWRLQQEQGEVATAEVATASKPNTANNVAEVLLPKNCSEAKIKNFSHKNQTHKVDDSENVVPVNTFEVGDQLEFFCETDKQWRKGKIASIETESGYFVKAVIKYRAFNKSRQQVIHREDWLR
ncbi:virulence-associated E family protein [Nostoc sp.]|uniref:virulence-associated E family protein n=1 Tax=Nostoc sp. TaxID=1180 RepID=UPI002FF64006